MARRPRRSGSSMTSRSDEPSSASPSPARDGWLELEVEPSLRRWNQRRKPCTIAPPPPMLLALRARRHWLPARPLNYIHTTRPPAPSKLLLSTPPFGFLSLLADACFPSPTCCSHPGQVQGGKPPSRRRRGDGDWIDGLENGKRWA